MLARGCPRSAASSRAAASSHDNCEGARFGHDLAGTRSGSSATARSAGAWPLRARAFGMQVLAYDPFVDRRRAAGRAGGRRPDGCWRGRTSSRSTPARPPDERRPHRRGEVARMKPGAFFVNTARESLVDEEALARRSRPGASAGAALDVVRDRTPRGSPPAARHPNVVHHAAHRRRDLRDPARGARWSPPRSSASPPGSRWSTSSTGRRSPPERDRAAAPRDRPRDRQLPGRRCSTDDGDAGRDRPARVDARRRCPACPARRSSTPSATGS